MTSLHKPVKRTLDLPLKGSSRTRAIIVTLYPGGVIGLRDKGRRREYTLPLTTVYALAAEAEARSVMAERKAARKAARSKP